MLCGEVLGARGSNAYFQWFNLAICLERKIKYIANSGVSVLHGVKQLGFEVTLKTTQFQPPMPSREVGRPCSELFVLHLTFPILPYIRLMKCGNKAVSRLCLLPSTFLQNPNSIVGVCFHIQVFPSIEECLIPCLTYYYTGRLTMQANSCIDANKT